MKLITEYERLKKGHGDALRLRAARVVLGSSVTRVFEKGTKEPLLSLLAGLDIDELSRLGSPDQFKALFERLLEIVAREIKRLNPRNRRIHPGYKWGHGTKVLTLYLCEMVLNSRYFPDEMVRRVSPWLYIPIDSIVMERLKVLGCEAPFKTIKEIDTAEKFYGVQNLLGQAATKVDVPRIWFDDNWAYRK